MSWKSSLVASRLSFVSNYCSVFIRETFAETIRFKKKFGENIYDVDFTEKKVVVYILILGQILIVIA